MCTTTDRRSLPALSTWYLTTNLPVPLAENGRLYGLRNWVEQGYKQMKDELGWANFMVRCDRAIHRHWTLVCCTFTFCWCLPNPCESVLGATRGGGKTSSTKALPCSTSLLRAALAWLTPGYWLTRCWAAFAETALPAELATLLCALNAGQ